ncbi:MAG: hypothetical protein ACRETA_09280 [Gammaproteobacteria bacterium]
MSAMNAAVGMNVPSLSANTAIALFYGLHNFTYEGGPALAYITITGASASDQSQILNQANLDPGMQAQTTKALTTAFENGVDMYMYYIGVQNSLWGATPDVLDLDAPKFAALKGLAGQMITRETGTSLPGSIPTSPVTFGVLSDGTLRPTYEATGWYCSQASGTSPAHCSVNGSVPDGTGLVYLVNASKAGSYSATLVLDTAQGSSASSVGLDVDGKSAGTFSIPQKPAGQSLTVGPLAVSLTAGLHIIAIKSANTAQGFSIDSINFTSQ